MLDLSLIISSSLICLFSSVSFIPVLGAQTNDFFIFASATFDDLKEIIFLKLNNTVPSSALRILLCAHFSFCSYILITFVVVLFY